MAGTHTWESRDSIVSIIHFSLSPNTKRVATRFAWPLYQERRIFVRIKSFLFLPAGPATSRIWHLFDIEKVTGLLFWSSWLIYNILSSGVGRTWRRVTRAWTIHLIHTVIRCQRDWPKRSAHPNATQMPKSNKNVKHLFFVCDDASNPTLRERLTFFKFQNVLRFVASS